MSKNKKHKNPNYFAQQKAFGDWTNLLEPPITFAELLSSVVITPYAPNGFVKSLEEFKLTAKVSTAAR